jgi:hypothetical protein
VQAGQVRRLLRAAAALLVLTATSGCGFMTDLARPEDPPTETAAPTSVIPAVGTPAREQPRVIAAGQLTTTGSGGGSLTVTVGKVQTGLVPPVPHVTECPMDGPSLQYVPVDFAFSSPGLAAHVEIGRGPATPADVAGVAVFAESANGDETYCDDAPPLPTRDRFWNQMGAATITVYVVLDQAVTPASPDGRSAVFPTLQLRISDLRVIEDPAHQRSLGVGPLTVAAACADDPDAICVPLA